MFVDAVISGRGAPAERNGTREHPAPPERERSPVREFYKHLAATGRNLSQFLTGLGWNRIAQLSVVLLIAGALKYFYSTASVNQLRWILAPTTLAVESISGQRFYFESYAGYINSYHTFVIAASCAGVNFLLTAFLMLALGKLWRNQSQQVSWSFIPVAAVIAYVATLVANTIRITTSIQLRELRIESIWLSAGQLHRLEGIFIYFGFLLLLYVISDRLSSAAPVVSAEDRLERKRLAGSEVRSTRKMQPGTVALQSLGRSRPLVTFQRCLFPLLIYYGTTLGLPLVNGAFRQTGFWEHSLFVLLIPLVFVIPFAGFILMKRIRRAIKPS